MLYVVIRKLIIPDNSEWQINPISAELRTPVRPQGKHVLGTMSYKGGYICQVRFLLNISYSMIAWCYLVQNLGLDLFTLDVTFL